MRIDNEAKRVDSIDQVHDRYAEVARSGLSNDTPAVRAVAQAFGYSASDLSSLPAEANMGLSCGNPVAVASLLPGEVVVDLGCGGGLDVLLAAQKVGPTGRVIGIDMTADMIDRARAGATKVGATNVEFHQARIDKLPLPDHSVDCIISNCVINLVPDKGGVFAEMLRVLKPGGRVAISDIALKQPLPEEIRSSIEAYVGCIAGAILIVDYRELLERVGFAAVTVSDTAADLNAYAQAGSGTATCCAAPTEPGEADAGLRCDADLELPQPESRCCSVPMTGGTASSSLHEQMAQLLSQFDANRYAASVRVHAVKRTASVTNRCEGTNPLLERKKATAMSKIQIYDKPMCCSTGICGPEVDPVLPRFAADLDWMKSQGHNIERFNLAQQPTAFANNETVKGVLATEGMDCLPLILVDGRVVSRAAYPERERLVELANDADSSLPGTATTLPVAGQAGDCCGGSSC